MSDNNFMIERSEFGHKINGNDIVFRIDLGKYSEIKYISHLNPCHFFNLWHIPKIYG